MSERKFSSFYKLNDEEINKIKEEVSGDNIRNSETLNPTPERAIPSTPERVDLPVLKVKKKSIPKIVEVVFFLAIFVVGFIAGEKFILNKHSENNSIPVDSAPVTTEEITTENIISKTQPATEKVFDEKNNEDNIVLDMDRYYGTWDNMFHAKNLPYNENAEFYGCDEKWIIPLLLRNIYIDENEMLVGLFDEPFDLSKVESEEHTDSKYYYISDIPSIRGVPDDSMPYSIKILNNMNGFISEADPIYF